MSADCYCAAKVCNKSSSNIIHLVRWDREILYYMAREMGLGGVRLHWFAVDTVLVSLNIGTVVTGTG